MANMFKKQITDTYLKLFFVSKLTCMYQKQIRDVYLKWSYQQGSHIYLFGPVHYKKNIKFYSQYIGNSTIDWRFIQHEGVFCLVLRDVFRIRYSIFITQANNSYCI